MREKKVKMISNNTNSAIVQIEGRSYPGVVVQGDSLYSLYQSSHCLLASLSLDSEKYDNAEFIRDSLKEYLSIYEKELAKQGINLPYEKNE